MKREKYTVEEEVHKQDYLIYSAFIGISVIVVIQLIGQNNLSVPLKISLYCFSISIPALATNIWLLFIEKSYKFTTIPIYIEILNFVGPISCLIGIGSLFFHFYWLMGVIFCITTILCFGLSIKFSFTLDDLNKDSELNTDSKSETNE